MNANIETEIKQLLQHIEELQEKGARAESLPSVLDGLKGRLEDLMVALEEKRSLRTIEDGLLQMISQCSDCLFLQDRDLRYIWFSRENPFGMDASRALGRTEIQIIPPVEVARLREIKKKVMETGKEERTQVHVAFQGSGRCFDATYYPWRDEFGNIVGLAGYVCDITEQKQAEREIGKMTKAVETAPTAIVLISLEGIIDYVNLGLLKSGGFCHAREVLGRSVFDFTDEEGKSKLEDEIIPALFSQGRWRGELPLRRKDGKSFIAEIISALVKDDLGEPSYFLANFYDITDRKRAEEALLLDESRLEALLKLNQMDEASLKDITDYALEAGVKLTNSKLGYLAFVDEEEKTLIMHSWSKRAMQECDIDHKKIVYPLEETGLWGEALRQRQAVITNDYLGSPKRRGTPQGHVKILRHMNIPIIDKGKIVVVAGVGNKEKEYDNADVRQLTLLMSGMWKLIQRRRTEEELRLRDRLLQGAAQAINYLLIPDPEAVFQALRILGEAADADRVVILENHDSENGECHQSLLLEWSRETVSAFPDCSSQKDISYQSLFPGWYELLSSGDAIQGVTSDLCIPGQKRLENPQIRSLLLLPIFINGRVSAVIGFEDCCQERRWADDEIAILKTAAGSIGEAIMRRRAEEALKESQRALSTLMGNLPGMAYRRSNDSPWTMEFVSDGCIELTGYRPAELIQKKTISYARIIHPDDLDYIQSEVQDAVAERRPFRLTYRIRSPAGTKWVWEQGQGIFGPKGELLALEGFVNDITERKLAEEALERAHEELEKRVQERTAWLLRANEALQEEMAEHKKTEKELLRAQRAADAASRAKGEFLANMSHEIRTPMNAVIGMAGLLLDTSLTLEQRDYVETIHSSGDALLSIINDILDFSKIDEGKMKLEHQPFDLEECIESSLDMVAAKVAEKGLDLNYMVVEDVPHTILGDSTRLRQVLANLLSNAVKFTDRGQVTVFVHRGDMPDEIQFDVKDTGIGISQEDISKLFQSFSQIDTSTSRKYGGTGLGLAISRRLVELMGGRIWANSELGKGSTFHFKIKAKSVPGQVQDLRLAGKRMIALVTNEACLKSLVNHVRSWGMQIYPVVSAAEARELAKNSFDVAILDMQVPGAGDLIAEMQENVPVISIAPIGHSGAGRNSLAKPVKLSRLRAALQNVLLPKNMRTKKISRSQIHQQDMRILLAEDNPVNQKVALLMLKRLGYRADVAANGREVLQALKRQKYDLVLMDVQMPEMDGLEAARVIREMDIERRPKILAMTAYALEGDRERCLGAGMDGYISKPVQMEELKTALDNLQNGGFPRKEES
jgi:PAS domain S-box-containing protein